LEKNDFLIKYNITEDVLRQANLEWNVLIDIYDDFMKRRVDNEPTAHYLTECLRKVEGVHSTQYRMKDPEHLLEKIIRKKRKNPEIDITKDNYYDIITDLTGVKVLHLFKADWETIHRYITETWDLIEKPKANIREGDVTDSFEEKNCQIVRHPFGYRSVHYLLALRPAKNLMVAELQVRTIFEEAWSEIDHHIRYPYQVDNPILGNYLEIFNRLAGSADEMGSFIKLLDGELKRTEQKHRLEMTEKDRIITELNIKIDSLGIGAKEKVDLQHMISNLIRLEQPKLMNVENKTINNK